jgi:hypothetical protein
MLVIQTDVWDAPLPSRARQGGLEVTDHQIRLVHRKTHPQSGEEADLDSELGIALGKNVITLTRV